MWGTRQRTALVMTLAGFLDFENFAILIVSALGADMMGALALVTVGALRERAGGDGVVGAAKRGAPFGVAALWVRHGENPFAAGARADRRFNLSPQGDRG